MRRCQHEAITDQAAATEKGSAGGLILEQHYPGELANFGRFASAQLNVALLATVLHRVEQCQTTFIDACKILRCLTNAYRSLALRCFLSVAMGSNLGGFGAAQIECLKQRKL